MRYLPASQADLASHQAMLVLLAQDVAHLDPELLERAIQRHVATSPYMPKAADLNSIAQSLLEPQTTLEAYAEELNAKNFTRHMGWHWFVNTDHEGRRFLDRKDGQWAA